jgi:serine/threonine protein kinase
VTEANDFDELLHPPVSNAAREHRPTKAIADEMELGGIHRDFGPSPRFGPNILHVKSGDLVSRKYRLLKLLAQGGMGEVWSVRNERTNRDFAIKFLLPALARHPEALQRFVREAKATGQLRHPNIVSVLDAGMHDRRPYLVMELLTGESLDECLTRVGKLKPMHASVILAQAARAVAHAHGMQLVHRDLSSANIYLSQTSEDEPPIIKVLDFGVSKVLTPELGSRIRTSDGAVLGSPAYMSPEQACGAEGVDERTDVWALGVLLYQCLTGKLPFRATNYNALMFAIASTPHEPLANQSLNLDPELIELVESCLVKDREHRLESAQAVADRLEHIAYRLSQRSPLSSLAAGRRATDRLRPSQARPSGWFGTAPLPWRVMSLSMRLSSIAKQGRGSFGVLAGLVVGCGLTYFANRSFDRAKLDGINATPVVTKPSECSPKTAVADPAGGLARNEIKPAVQRAAPAEKETDLVRAVARGLSKSESAPPLRAAGEHAR